MAHRREEGHGRGDHRRVAQDPAVAEPGGLDQPGAAAERRHQQVGLGPVDDRVAGVVDDQHLAARASAGREPLPDAGVPVEVARSIARRSSPFDRRAGRPSWAQKVSTR